MVKADLKMLKREELEELLESILHELAEQQSKVGHLDSQFRTTYWYLVGDWAGSPKAKSTRDGRFVPNKEVADFLRV